jgi:hypothetical protein
MIKTQINILKFTTEWGKYQAEHPKFRTGQCCFNVLHNMYPDLANQLRGTEADPYYYNTDDEKFELFWKWVDLNAR